MRPLRACPVSVIDTGALGWLERLELAAAADNLPPTCRHLIVDAMPVGLIDTDALRTGSTHQQYQQFTHDLTFFLGRDHPLIPLITAKDMP